MQVETTTRTHDPDADAWARWATLAQQPAIDGALRALYEDLDRAVAARGPTCWQSGKCCHFGTYGHRLYVTALELAWFLQQPCTPPTPAPSPEPAGHALRILHQGASHEDAMRCPFQVGQSCSTHAVRPLGCRVFFCQQGTEHWQHALYERYLAHLRTLHERYLAPYRYLEWLAGLDEARAALRSGR